MSVLSRLENARSTQGARILFPSATSKHGNRLSNTEEYMRKVALTAPEKKFSLLNKKMNEGQKIFKNWKQTGQTASTVCE